MYLYFPNLTQKLYCLSHKNVIGNVKISSYISVLLKEVSSKQETWQYGLALFTISDHRMFPTLQNTGGNTFFF